MIFWQSQPFSFVKCIVLNVVVHLKQYFDFLKEAIHNVLNNAFANAQHKILCNFTIFIYLGK
ncbi:MAG TPA: hypothetical protein DCR46_03015 [Cytophagales bacterium]|nr:hypothetical protein [Cytophagales bacterium]